MLQVAGRTSRLKHKALLMSPTPPTDEFSKPDFSEEAALFPGDAFERMCLDPELVRTRKQLLAGVGAVFALSVVATVLQFTGFGWRSKGRLTESPPVLSSLEQPSAQMAPQAPAPLINKPLITTESLKRITFRSARSEDPVSLIADEPQTILEKFLSAASVDEKLTLVHDPMRVEPAMRA